MLHFDPFDDVEVTSSPFRVVIHEDEPFSFASVALQNVQSSVRLTHIVYTPPTSLESWQAYKTQHPLDGADDHRRTVSISAKVRTLTSNKKIESFVVAAFPLKIARIAAIDADMQKLNNGSSTTTTTSSSSSSSCAAVRFGRCFDVVMPETSDIVSGLNVRLDVDGDVALMMSGPGSCTFFGEQLTALVPEWMAHGMFQVGEDDEEEEALDD